MIDLLSAERPDLRVAHTVTHPDGTFQFDSVAPGSYVVLAASTSGQFGRTRVTVAGQNTEVSLQAGSGRTVTVTLRADPGCGTAANLTFTPVDGWMAARKPTLSVNAEKPATITALGPLRYAVNTDNDSSRCYASVPRMLDLTEETARTLEVVLAPPGSIRGHLAGGVRPRDYMAVLIPADGSLMRVAYPDSDANIRFDALPPGTYYVNAVPIANGRWMPADGHLPPAVEVRPGAAASLELRVPEAAR